MGNDKYVATNIEIFLVFRAFDSEAVPQERLVPSELDSYFFPQTLLIRHKKTKTKQTYKKATGSGCKSHQIGNVSGRWESYTLTVPNYIFEDDGRFRKYFFGGW